MSLHRAARTSYLPALLLTLAAAGVGSLSPASIIPVKRPDQVRLENPVQITAAGVMIDAVAILPDNESVVVVGGIPRDLKDPDWVYMDAPPAGAIVNLKTKAVRPFTNGHTRRMISVACSADGARLFTGSTEKDPFVRIWDVKAGKSLVAVPVPRVFGSFRLASFTASRKVAVTLEKSVAVIDPDGKGERLDLTAEALARGSPCQVAVSPDDQLVACHTNKGDALVWDVKSRKVVYSGSLLPAGADEKWHIAKLGFARDATRLLATRNWDGDEAPRGKPANQVTPEPRGLLLIDTGKRQVTPLGMAHQIRTVEFAFHPSGEWVATVGGSRPDRPDPKGLITMVGELRVYHFPTRSLALRVQSPDDFFAWVAFTPDGRKLVAVDHESKVRAWDFVPAKR